MDATSFLVASASDPARCLFRAGRIADHADRPRSLLTGTAAAGGDDRDSRHLRRRRSMGCRPARTRSSSSCFHCFWPRIPDGRFVPRWTVAIVLAWIVLGIVEWLGAGLTDQPWWWMVPAASMLTLLGAQLYRYLRRSAAPQREAVRWAILGPASSAVFFLIIELTGDGQIAGDVRRRSRGRSWP